MSVKKIFIILITVVACVMVGALVLNILMPNVMTSLIDSTENMIYNATGMSMDFNGNKVRGDKSGSTSTEKQAGTKEGANGANVKGFKEGMK